MGNDDAMKTWLLVYIVISMDGIDVGQVANTKTISECFEAREELLVQVNPGEERFPINQQAICMQVDVGF
jgi:hypothetical protein